MWHKTLSRVEFADLLGNLDKRANPPSPDGINLEAAPSADSVVVFWSNASPPQRFSPILVVVADNSLRDFLAWAATFFGSFRPFTSFCRVLPWSLVSNLTTRSEISLDDLETVCVGAVMGEALTEARTRTVFDTLSIQAFASTYSFAMSRAWALHHSDVILQRIPENWTIARELTEQPKRKLPLRDLTDVWAVIRVLSSSSHRPNDMDFELNLIARACRELRDQREIDAITWDQLNTDKIGYRQMRRDMSGPREERVRFFERFVEDLRPGNSRASSFCCGYLASLISEGSLDHIDLLFRHLDQLPTAAIWYAVCGGLSPSSKLMSDKGGLGRRLLREIEAPGSVSHPPQADIAVDELRVLFSSDNRPPPFIRRNINSISVEVAPAVQVSLRWSSTQRGDSSAATSAANGELAVTLSVLQQMGESLEKTLAIYKGIMAHFRQAEPRENPPTSRKSKRRSTFFGREDT